MQAILGQKKQQTQKFLEDGTRIPVTLVRVDDNPVVMVKTADSDGYWSVQLGYGIRKNANQPLKGHTKKAQLTNAPQFLKEVRIKEIENADELPKVGEFISVNSVLKPGDIIDVTGTSKGKGFAGGVKRYHFKGGPRTHGQSDRERAPGSIGQTTTPGRVYRGKKMAGKMGFATVTVKNLEVIDVLDGTVLVKGLVPGKLNAVIYIKKRGENKKFVPLLKADEKNVKEEIKLDEKTEEIKNDSAEEKIAEEVKEEQVTPEKGEDTDASK